MAPRRAPRHHRRTRERGCRILIALLYESIASPYSFIESLADAARVL
jgi:hypothetical protein